MGSNKYTGERSHRVVEKRRRDRINTCLKELSSAVPGALNKQTSGKLEKAEILEMTVKYLQDLEVSSPLRADWLNNEYKFQTYQTGFDECVREVARCLPDLGHHPISRLRGQRLLTHLLAARETRGGATYAARLPGPHDVIPGTVQCTFDAAVAMTTLSADRFAVNLKQEPSAYFPSRTGYYNAGQSPTVMCSTFAPYCDSRMRLGKYCESNIM